jgi:hypothetical protein
MFHALAFVGLPLLFMADYLAIIIWLMQTSGKPDKPFRFSLRALLIAITIAAIHLGAISAFLSASP